MWVKFIRQGGRVGPMTEQRKAKPKRGVSARPRNTSSRAGARSKAKAKPQKPPKPPRKPKAERVRQILQLMADCQWVTGVSIYEMADEWGIPSSTVETDSAEASRLLSFAASQETEGLGPRFLTNCQRQWRDCLEKERQASAIKDFKTAVQYQKAAAVWAQLLAKVGGLELQRVEVTSNLGDAFARALEELERE